MEFLCSKCGGNGDDEILASPRSLGLVQPETPLFYLAKQKQESMRKFERVSPVPVSMRTKLTETHKTVPLTVPLLLLRHGTMDHIPSASRGSEKSNCWNFSLGKPRSLLFSERFVSILNLKLLRLISSASSSCIHCGTDKSSIGRAATPKFAIVR